MSGRHPRTFATNGKAEDVEKLAARFKNGYDVSKCKAAEYDRMQVIAGAKQLESALMDQVQRTRRGAKATKESSILRQHRQVWSRECPRLQKAEQKAESEIHDFLAQMRPNGKMDTAIFSLQDCELVVEREQEAFRRATVEPVYQLRDDLLFRLGEVRHQQLSTHSSDWEQVQQQINLVKEQQDDIIAKLQAEYLNLDQEIMALDFEKYLTASDSPGNAENILEEVLHADCPFPELKELLIQAFHSLSKGYQGRLQSLQEQLQRTDRFCGWCSDDHLRFLFTLSQYTQDVPNHRSLSLDMLQRLFPRRTKQELMDHERLWDWQRFTQAQTRVVTRQRQRDQEELLAKALATLRDAKAAHQEQLELHRDRQHQQDICLQLKNKLQQWRAQQEEVAKLEAAIAARQREQEEATLKRKQEKETAVRTRQKEKIQEYYSKQQKLREELETKDQERLANLRKDMEEQARRDKERVRFRADMLQQRREEREEREAERQRAEEERRSRLEALRNQVVVVAEADPERVMADTQSWRIRHLNTEESEPRKPLYTLNTYTDAQIVSDPRFRIEHALREAGLQRSQYAKEVLSTIKPPKPPRRDTASLLQF